MGFNFEDFLKKINEEIAGRVMTFTEFSQSLNDWTIFFGSAFKKCNKDCYFYLREVNDPYLEDEQGLHILKISCTGNHYKFYADLDYLNEEEPEEDGFIENWVHINGFYLNY